MTKKDIAAYTRCDHLEDTIGLVDNQALEILEHKALRVLSSCTIMAIDVKTKGR